MATSLRYNFLAERIVKLQEHLLPAINTTGSYTDKDQDMIRSFCLLCHAEMEAYLEDFTLEIVTKAFNKWDTDKTKISPIIFHLAYTYTSKSKELPYSMVVNSYSSFKKTIEGNHGVKENNLVSFFKPIGFNIDPTLKSTLNEFGKNRGQIAHTSFRTQQPLDPTTEKNLVNLILNGLKMFDQELSTYEDSGLINRSPIKMKWEKYSLFERLKILFTGKI